MANCKNLTPEIDNICKHLASKLIPFMPSMWEYEDILQEARILAWKAQSRYDPCRGMKLTSFIWMSVKSDLINIKDTCLRKKRFSGVDDYVMREIQDKDFTTECIDSLSAKEIISSSKSEKESCFLTQIAEGNSQYMARKISHLGQCQAERLLRRLGRELNARQ